MLYFSPSARAFYDDEIHDGLPSDAVQITRARHEQLLAGQAAGKRIVAGSDGRPRLAAKDALPIEQRRELALRSARREASRRILQVATIEAQSNDNALIAQQALQIAQSGASTIDAAPALERRAQIDWVRDASNKLEQWIVTMDAAALATLDPSSPAHWPN